MLKHFYKTLMVSFLCGSLLMLDFSYKSGGVRINSVKAETLTTQGIGDGDLMSTLTMTGIGLIASRLYTYKQTTDTMIAAAAGVAFIAGEVIAYTDLDHAIKDIETQLYRDKKGDLDQRQIDLLQRLKESYQEALKTANTKKSLQSTAAAAFAMAAIAAAVLKSSEAIAFQGCSAVLTSAGTACPLSSATATAANTSLTALQTGREAGGSSMTSKTTETTGLTTFTTSLSTLSASLGTSATSYAATCAASEGTATAACGYAGTCASAAGTIQSCNAVQSTCQMTGAYGIVGTISYNPFMPKRQFITENQSQNFFGRLAKFFIPEANAGLLDPMGIASGVAIRYVMAQYVSVGATIDNFLFTPLKRASAWAVMAGLTYAASGSTDNQIEIINENIQKIDKILNAMKSYSNGVAQSQTPGVSNQTIETNLAHNTALGVNGSANSDINLAARNMTMPCFTSENSKDCPSFSNQLNSQSNLNTMTDSMQTQIGTLGRIVDGVNGVSRISGSTLSEINALGSQAKALNAEMIKRHKELQATLKASGSKYDLEKESAKLAADIKAATQKELDKSKMTAGQMLASFGGGRGGLGSGAVATDANKNVKDAKIGKKGVGMAIPVVAVPAAKIPTLDDEDIADSLKDEDKAAQEAALTADAKANASTMDDYDLKNDITQDKESSIFELISNRYQKSGYPRLFKRIK